MATIGGTCEPAFEAVRQAFASNFDELDDVGACVAVTVDGRFVVDLWGGTCTTDDGPAAWRDDTLVNVWSCTKTISFLVTLMLADQGMLDLGAPVADVWPEFAAAGKQAIDTTHVLSHSAGLPGWDVPGVAADLYDWELMTSRLAAQAPWWQPGDRSGYHAITQGFLLGELCRRVTGRTIGEYFATEVAAPLGSDFHIGIGPDHDARIAHVIPPPDVLGAGALRPGTIPHRTYNSIKLDAAESASIAWRRAELPSLGGHGNARSIARAMSVLANHGTLDGRRYLSPDMCARIFEEQQFGRDRVLMRPLRFGLGFGLRHELAPLPNDHCCYWGGWGGSFALVDMQNRLSLAYVMNDMRHNIGGDARPARLVLAAYQALANLQQ